MAFIKHGDVQQIITVIETADELTEEQRETAKKLSKEQHTDSSKEEKKSGS